MLSSDLPFKIGNEGVKAEKNNSKAAITSIDWSIDGKFICVAVKNENLVIVWNINTCEQIFVF
jgi:hypothetical protein